MPTSRTSASAGARETAPGDLAAEHPERRGEATCQRGDIFVARSHGFDGEPLIDLVLPEGLMLTLEEARWLQAVALPTVLNDPANTPADPANAENEPTADL